MQDNSRIERTVRTKYRTDTYIHFIGTGDNDLVQVLIWGPEITVKAFFLLDELKELKAGIEQVLEASAPPDETTI